MENLIRLKKVQKRTGLPRSTLYHYVNLNKFPRPVKLSARSVAWIESEVDAWIQQRINANKNSEGK